MTKQMKKLWSLVLTATIIFSLVVPAVAVNSKNNIVDKGKGNTVEIANENRMDLLESVFGGNSDERANAESLKVSYEYELYQNEDSETGPYSVIATISFINAENTYNFVAEGNIETILLDNGLTYLTGPLYGAVRIDGVVYQVIVGFNKVLEREGVSFCVTLAPEESTFDQVLSFSFGDQIMTTDVLTSLIPEETQNLMEIQSNAKPYAVTDKGSVTGVISGTTKTGIKENMQVENSAKQVVSNVYSYTANAKTTVAYAYSATVKQINYALIRNSGISEIIGLKESTTKNIKPGDNPTAENVINVILFALQVCKNPYVSTFTGIIVPIIREETAKMYTKNITATTGRFYMQFGLGAKAINFDQAPCAVAYQLSGNGVGSFTAYASIEYAVLGDAGYSYVKTAEVSKQVGTSF